MFEDEYNEHSKKRINKEESDRFYNIFFNVIKCDNCRIINVPGNGNCYIFSVLVSLCYKVGLIPFLKIIKRSCCILKLKINNDIKIIPNDTTLQKYEIITNYFNKHKEWFNEYAENMDMYLH